MKRILAYIPGATFGGAHNQVLQMWESLRSAGYEVVVLLPDEPGNALSRLRERGIETHVADLNRLRATRDLGTHWQLVRGFHRQVRFLETFIAQLDVEVVQIHGITCVDGAMAARHLGKPLVWQLIDTRAPMALRVALMPYVRASGATVMTVGTHIQQQYPGLASLGPRLVDFYPPVNRAAFAVDGARRGKARAQLGIPDDRRAVVCLANLNPQKGIERLLKASAMARDRGLDFELRIRGAESFAHPGYRESLEALARGLGFGGEVVGVLEPGLEPPDFMRAGDVFALASNTSSEGIPTVVLEAMCAGLPIVATAAGGVEEVVSSEVGSLVPPDDEEAFAAALASMVARPSAELALVGERARVWAAAEVSVEQCVDEHVGAYEQAIRTAPPRQPATAAVPVTSVPGRDDLGLANGALRRTRFELRSRLATSEVASTVFLQLPTRYGHLIPPVDRTTDLVVDGFVSSGNSFLTRRLRASNPALTIRGHFHASGQIHRALRLGIPSVVLFRDPTDVVVSAITRWPWLRPQMVVAAWCRYYMSVLGDERICYVPFRLTVGDPDALCAVLDERFELQLRAEMTSEVATFEAFEAQDRTRRTETIEATRQRVARLDDQLLELSGELYGELSRQAVRL